MPCGATNRKEIKPACDVTDPHMASVLSRVTTRDCKMFFSEMACTGVESHGVSLASISVGRCTLPEINIDEMRLAAPMALSETGDREVRIVFLITVSGRSLRQTRQLLRTIYRSHHYYFIHVDERDDYLHRKLYKLSLTHPNIALAQARYRTTWASPTRLRMFQFNLAEILALKNWTWHYIVYIQGSDFPVRPVDELEAYLGAYRGYNFIATQVMSERLELALGFHHTFVQCEGHVWLAGNRSLPTNVNMGVGNDRMMLSRDFAEYVIWGADDFLLHMRRHWKYSIVPLESFLQTLSLNTKFCRKLVANNLFLRNLEDVIKSCACQEEHMTVDWCLCSGSGHSNATCCFPNIYGIHDIDELLKKVDEAIETPVFFASDFDGLVSQEAINKLHITVHRDISPGVKGLHYHWHNLYHYLDRVHLADDAALTHFDSFIRMATPHTLSAHCSPAARARYAPGRLLEVHSLDKKDNFEGYLVKFQVNEVHSADWRENQVHVVEAFIKASSRPRLKKSSHGSLFSRLLASQIGRRFDMHKEIFHPLGFLLGPFSTLDLVTYWAMGSEGETTAVIVDPAGDVVVMYNVKIGLIPQRQVIDAGELGKPLRPGWWTVKYMGGSHVGAEDRFLVLPLAYRHGQELGKDEDDEAQLRELHGGPQDGYHELDYKDANIPGVTKSAEEVAKLAEAAEVNAGRTGKDLLEWIDSLVRENWKVQDVCFPQSQDQGQLPPCFDVPFCEKTSWSSFSQDVKSDLPTM